VLSVGRQIASALVDPAAEPLAQVEAVIGSVPADGTDLFGWAAPGDHAERSVSCQEHVKSRGGSGHDSQPGQSRIAAATLGT
jgi:hypothetical protein